MDAAAQTPAKRPKLVWVVFLFYLFSLGYTALSFYLVLSGSVSAPGQATYLRNLSVFDWAITGLTAALNLAGAISIFLLRRIAFPLFATSLALSIFLTLVHVFTTSLTSALGGPGALGLAIGYAISIAVCTYAWKLRARGVLL